MKKLQQTLRLALAALALGAAPAAVVFGSGLFASGLTQSANAQTVSFPINLNTASDSEILAVPSTGQRMLREFKEYRPYATVDQFKQELGKYVSSDVIAKWLEYVYVPTNPNTASEAQLMALKGVSKAIAKDIIAKRSYKDWNALKASLSKTFDAKTVVALERYWIFN